MSYVKESLRGLRNSLLQGLLNIISDQVFKIKRNEAIRLCRQYHCKYYVIQQGYYNWQVLRAGDVDLYKRKGLIAKTVNAMELEKISAFVARPKNCGSYL